MSFWNPSVSTPVLADLLPVTTNLYSLGNSTYKWKDLWLAGTANTVRLAVSSTSTFTGLVTANGNVTTPQLTATTQVNTPLIDNGAGGEVKIGNTTADTINIAAGHVVKDSSGNLYGSAVHNNPSPPSGTVNQPFGLSGSATPTVTAGTNVATAAANGSQYYMRVGNVVFGFLRVDIDPTAGSTATTFDISVPVASNFTVASHAGAIAIRVSGSLAPLVAAGFGATGTDTISFNYLNDADTANRTWFILFAYVVV